MKSIPVIDLFAGPGGLGEGFSALLGIDQKRIFKISLSIEKDIYAHKTLELRAFFRFFNPGNVPEDYYNYLTGKINRDELFARYPEAAKHAMNEAWLAELGSDKPTEDDIDERIKRSLGSEKKWVLIGGPPCQAYSLVGRSRVIGGEGIEKYEADPRHRLYRHYLRILAIHQPPVFIMENVKGLLSAKLKNENTIENILSDLRMPLKALPKLKKKAQAPHLEYRLVPVIKKEADLFGEFTAENFVVKAEEYGIPQARHRIIIMGIRSDINVNPDVLTPSPQCTIEQVIDGLPSLRSGLSQETDSAGEWKKAIQEISMASWLNDGALSNKLCMALKKAIKSIIPGLSRGQQFIKSELITPVYNPDWYYDKRLKGICNHETRGHIRTDLHRYFFATVFAQTFGKSPLLEDFPAALLPEHKNVTEALKSNLFNDRFRVQIAGRPSTTIVSHIAKDGHYYIHYDPTQCRCLTVREAARLQTFPDNYFFEGPRTEQYKQVGNAVPPFLAWQIAGIVAKILNKNLKR